MATMSVFEKMKNGLGVPFTSDDIIVLMNTPLSFIQQMMAGYIREIWARKVIDEEMQLLNELRRAEEEFLNYLYARLMMWASRVNLNDIGLTEDDIDAEREAVAKVIAMQEELDQLYKQIDQENTTLAMLTDKRDRYVATMPEAWYTQQRTQVRSMTERLNTFISLPIEEGGLGLTPLTEHDQRILSKVAKAQRIMLEQPKLIPPDVTVNSAMDKANNNLNLNLMRVLSGKQASQHPDEMKILKPRQVKKLDDWAIKILQSDYWEIIKKKDAELMIEQQRVLEDFYKQIKEHQDRIDKIYQEIGGIEQRFEEVKFHAKPPTLEMKAEIARLKEQASTVDINEVVSPIFFQKLEMLYDAAAREYGKNTAQCQRAFEYKLTTAIRKLSSDEQQQFWQNCEKHAKYEAVSDKQRELFLTVKALQEELIPGLSSHRRN